MKTRPFRVEEIQFESLPNLPVARRWRQQVHPMPSVLAIIRRDSISSADEAVTHYLLIKRQKEPYIGKWALVGGGWDFGERLEAAITREVKEETGLDTMFVALRGVVNERIAPLGSNDDGGHFLLFVCEVSAPAGQAREQSEGPVAWFGPEDLKELSASQQIVSTDYAILQHFGQTASARPYIEAEAVAGNGENAPDELVRFEARR
jgi:ADP-ribose pyrophosphatase YjhB (NUDIX family)